MQAFCLFQLLKEKIEPCVLHVVCNKVRLLFFPFLSGSACCSADLLGSVDVRQHENNQFCTHTHTEVEKFSRPFPFECLGGSEQRCRLLCTVTACMHAHSSLRGRLAAFGALLLVGMASSGASAPESSGGRAGRAPTARAPAANSGASAAMLATMSR